MKLYSWESEALRQYGAGQIVVMAKDVDTARAKALRGAFCYFSQYNYLKWGEDIQFDDEDEETLRSFLALVEKDIALEPSEVDGGAVLIDGSQ